MEPKSTTSIGEAFSVKMIQLHSTTIGTLPRSVTVTSMRSLPRTVADMIDVD